MYEWVPDGIRIRWKVVYALVRVYRHPDPLFSLLWKVCSLSVLFTKKVNDIPAGKGKSLTFFTVIWPEACYKKSGGGRINASPPSDHSVSKLIRWYLILRRHNRYYYHGCSLHGTILPRSISFLASIYGLKCVSVRWLQIKKISQLFWFCMKTWLYGYSEVCIKWMKPQQILVNCWLKRNKNFISFILYLYCISRNGQKKSHVTLPF